MSPLNKLPLANWIALVPPNALIQVPRIEKHPPFARLTPPLGVEVPNPPEIDDVAVPVVPIDIPVENVEVEVVERLI